MYPYYFKPHAHITARLTYYLNYIYQPIFVTKIITQSELSGNIFVGGVIVGVVDAGLGVGGDVGGCVCFGAGGADGVGVGVGGGVGGGVCFGVGGADGVGVGVGGGVGGCVCFGVGDCVGFGVGGADGVGVGVYISLHTIFSKVYEHSRVDNPDLYYWLEITRQYTQTFNI